jgi:hypothetical protein
LHSPSIHIDVGLARLTHIGAKARLPSGFPWEHEIGTTLTLLYGFLAEVLQVPFVLRVSEVHLCVDLAGWEISLADVATFITRSRSKGLRLFPSDALSTDDESFINLNDVRLQFAGRRLATLDFSKGVPHVCCLYDKTTFAWVLGQAAHDDTLEALGDARTVYRGRIGFVLNVFHRDRHRGIAIEWSAPSQHLATQGTAA